MNMTNHGNVSGICKVDGCNKMSRSKNSECEMHYYRMRRNGSYELPEKKTQSRKIDFEINANNCFEVTSHERANNGYFLIRLFGKRISMHRHIYEQCFGKIPKNKVIRHKCDNKKCINPEHLEIGTIQENVKDAVDRNLYLRGEEHKMAKLKENEVIKIRRLIAENESHKKIATRFNIDPSTVSAIKRNKIWGHLI